MYSRFSSLVPGASLRRASLPTRRAASRSLAPCLDSSPAAAARSRRPRAAQQKPRSLAAGRFESRWYAACGCRGAKRTTTAYIAFGSNVGDRVAEIERACNEMDSRGIKVTRTSSLWETEPMYVLDQDRFLNGVCEVETELEPIALLDQLQSIERDLGRRKLIDKGPRNIDLDILLYGNEIISNQRLNVPHIGIAEREFVLRPLSELVPQRAIDPNKPWKLVQDYLNMLPVGEPLSTVTRLSATAAPLTPLRANRKTRIMGILNLTPDSFSDGGKHAATADLPGTILAMVRGGATMIDVGGQSTAPGREEVTAEEEAARVLPAVELIRSMPACRDVVLSVDTYRASVAEQALRRGADMINDVSAGQLDAEMLPTVSRLGATICLMHMRGTPRTMSSRTDYGSGGAAEEDGVVGAVAGKLAERVREAEAAGIRRWRVLVDPGLGFAKTAEQSVEVLRGLGGMRGGCGGAAGLAGLGWVVGPSRKSFVGAVTGVREPAARVWGTAGAVAGAVAGGADVVRVHDVEEMAGVVAMCDAIWRC